MTCSTSKPTLPDVQDTPKTATSQSGALTLAALEGQVRAVEVSVPMEQVLETHAALEFMAGQIKELRKTLDAQLMEWIEANGPIVWGSKRMYVGTKKDTKCKDTRQAVEALMNDCDGDFDAFCGCLASNALKHGACKAVMKEETYGQHFEVIVKTELREGVETPVKQLKEVDEAFLPRKNKR